MKIKGKILVTGGGGFIGSHLVKKLMSADTEVGVLSRRPSPLWRLEDVMDKLNVFNADIRHKDALKKIFMDFKPEYIFHLAGYGVQISENDINIAVETNINGMKNIACLAKEVGSKKIINIGTCAEYGDKKQKIIEKMCLDPRSIYGSTKAAATILGHQIARESQIDMVTLRLFGVFGESEPRHKIFCEAIMTLLENRDLALTSCTQYRDYCYVGDVVRAIVMAAENEEVKNEVFNVGTGTAFSLRYYIEKIHKILRSQNKLLFGHIKSRKNELWFPDPDINKISSMLGWAPIYSLEESIRKTIDWYVKNFDCYSNY